eukprot:303504-Rhodomonas_salina.3
MLPGAAPGDGKGDALHGVRAALAGNHPVPTCFKFLNRAGQCPDLTVTGPLPGAPGRGAHDVRAGAVGEGVDPRAREQGRGRHLLQPRAPPPQGIPPRISAQHHDGG